jgi:drug/metabolite transporter (DMT)-like permease
MARAGDTRQGGADSRAIFTAHLHLMTESILANTRARIAPAGLFFLAITSMGWGFNWPATKYLIGEVPPLTLRGLTGVAGACLLALLALARGQSLKVEPKLLPRLMLAALLNVTGWMVLMGLALLWLPAGETALIAYTMPVWAAMLAWPVLGERPTPLRLIALVMAFGGLATIMGGNGLAASAAQLPGILLALAGAIGFALGTVLSKKRPLQLPPFSAAAWQVGLGCLPVAIAGLLIETTPPAALTPLVWLLMFYSVAIAFCLCYITWFGALARLPASVAAIGTMAVPVIGVVVSALTLHEPFGIIQIAALVLTVSGVALAALS